VRWSRRTRSTSCRPGKTYWVTVSHYAPCGLSCFGASVPGKAYKANDVHRSDRCPRCPSARPKGRAPRPRSRAVVTAPVILGALTLNEVKVLAFTLRPHHDDIGGWRQTYSASQIGAQIKMPEATVRGVLRSLSTRGVTTQNPQDKRWRLNLPLAVLGVPPGVDIGALDTDDDPVPL
jgi:hypothetical protein